MMKRYVLTITLIFFLALAQGQSITGVWRGKVSRGLKHYNLELKLVRNGDSLTGTSYYYVSASHYSRFLVKGYFDISGDIIWWDDELIETKGSKISSPNSSPFRFAADFNCPGNDIMMLDGTGEKNRDEGKEHEIHLSKVERPQFEDQWDEVIEDFPYYAGIPEYIDSVGRSTVIKSPPAYPPLPRTTPSGPATAGSSNEKVEPTTKSTPKETSPFAKAEPTTAPLAKSTPAKSTPPVSIMKPEPPKSIEEKFLERKKLLFTEIPISGDSIKLAFYDHAEIDGDSITLFLNGKMIHQHILLKAIPFEFALAVQDLSESNELIMVAENLGSIPPNTSLMIVWVNGVRHEARLESTENSSAMIRFTKAKPAKEQALLRAPGLP